MAGLSMADLNVTYLPKVWFFFLHHISGSWGFLPSPSPSSVKAQLWDNVSLIFNKQYWSGVQPTASITAYFPIDSNFLWVCFFFLHRFSIIKQQILHMNRWMLWKSRWPLCCFKTHDHLLMISMFSNLYARNRWGRRTHPGKMETLQFAVFRQCGCGWLISRGFFFFLNRFFKSSRALFVYRTWFAEQASWTWFALRQQTDAHCQNTMNHTNDGGKKEPQGLSLKTFVFR